MIRRIAYYIALSAFLLVIAAVMMRYVRARYYSSTQTLTDTISVTHDTIYVTHDVYTHTPRVRDSIILRYRTIAVRDTLHDTISEIVRASHDSVRLCIAQRVYADTLIAESDTYAYTAYVSGYDARLDSLRVTSASRVTTTRELIRSSTSPSSPTTSRWGIGLQAGMYFTPAGLSPGVGVGITYSVPLRRIFGKKY